MGSVGGVSDEKWKLFSHFNLGQTELMVEGAPELGLEGLSGQLRKVHLEVDGSEDSLGSLETFVVGKFWSKTLAGQNVLVD